MTHTSPDTVRRGRGDAGENTTNGGSNTTRERILDTTAQLIAKRGFHSVRVSDVAGHLGISTALVHYHFDGKDALLNAALMHAVERAFSRQSPAVRQLDSARDRLATLIDMQLPRDGELHDEWSIWLQFWAEATVRPELRTARNDFYGAWYSAVKRTIDRGVERGEFRIDTESEVVARRLTAMNDGLAVLYLSGSQQITIASMKEILIRYVDDELLPR